MATINSDNINELLKQVTNSMDMNDVYDNVLTKYIDIVKLKEEADKLPLTAEEIGKHYAYAGFCFGIRFALENIEIKENDE